ITNRLDVDDLRAVRTEFQNNIFAPGISSINPSGLYLSGIGGIYHSAQYNNPATGSGTSYNVLALRPIAPQTISTVQFPQITGNGNAYACLDSQGYLYRSNAPCI
ncbi:hypothetical protein HN604_03450, partial [archaeon]|nr:hypothetical protein [archaeon]